MINETGLISIIIPFYNSSKYLEETIQSVVNQVYENWELILIDDGSEDNSFELAKKFTLDKRVKLFKRESKIKGASVCRNEGARKSKGNYLIFLDSDDLMASYCLLNRIKFVNKSPGYNLYIFPVELFENNPGDLNKYWNIKTNQDDILRFLRQDMPWCISSPVWEKETFKEINGFNESSLCWQDWEIHLRLLINKKKIIYASDFKTDIYIRDNRKNPDKNRISYREKSIEYNQNILDTIDLIFIRLKQENIFINYRNDLWGLYLRRCKKFYEYGASDLCFKCIYKYAKKLNKKSILTIIYYLYFYLDKRKNNFIIKYIFKVIYKVENYIHSGNSIIFPKKFFKSIDVNH